MSYRTARKGDGEPVYELMAMLGFLTGLFVGVWTFGATGSPALGLGVCVLISYVLGRAIPEVTMETQHIRRAEYLLIGPVVGVAVTVAVLALNGPAWIAVGLGLALGPAAQFFLGGRLLPDIAADERGRDLGPHVTV